MTGAAESDRFNERSATWATAVAWAAPNGEAVANRSDGIRISRRSEPMEAVVPYEPFAAEEVAAIVN